MQEHFPCTINMEWVSPTNQIVVPYKEDKLVILNIRKHDGSYVDLPRHGTEFLVDEFIVQDDEGFIDSIPEMNSDDSDTIIEGYVIKLHDGDMIKVKTDRYVRLHHTKDNISNDKKLFEIVVRGEHDDLRSLLFSDPISVDRIDQMEAFALPVFNHFVAKTEKFYEDNKHLSQKEYAILGQQVLDRLQFSVVMSLYNKKSLVVLDYVCKNSDKFTEGYEYIANL